MNTTNLAEILQKVTQIVLCRVLASKPCLFCVPYAAATQERGQRFVRVERLRAGSALSHVHRLVASSKRHDPLRTSVAFLLAFRDEVAQDNRALVVSSYPVVD